MDELLKTLEKNNFDMNSIADRDEYKGLCNEDHIEI
jgi:hypothetical protein